MPTVSPVGYSEGKAGGLIFVPLKTAVPEMALKGPSNKAQGRKPWDILGIM
jgi:hypothetical protein